MAKGLLILFLPFLVLDTTKANVLNWDQCVEQLAQNNPELLKLKEDDKVTYWNTESAKAGFYPKVWAEVQSQKSGTKNTTQKLHSAELGTSLNLLAVFTESPKVAKAHALSLEQKAKALQKKAQLSFDLKNTVSELIYAQELTALTQDIIERREENLRIVQMRFQNGRENKGSIFLFEAYLEEARYEELLAQNNLTMAQEKLARLLGLGQKPEETQNLKIDKKSTPLFLPPPFDLKENFKSEDLALLTPEWQEIEAIEKKHSADLELAYKAFWPHLSLNAGVQNRDQDFFPNEEKSWSVGLQFQIPLFDGGRDYSAVYAQKAQKMATTHLKDNLKNVLALKLNQARLQLIEASAKQKVDEKFEHAALVRAEIARSKYHNGLISFEDWDTIENDLILRQKSLRHSKHHYAKTLAAFYQSLGKGVVF